ncbi:expressed unknown protein [Seminavis robusta]|uniref:Uncharacterized protein n=1 Tax=Seminavis robusta TaxID=568900 RepID=A0A9N8DAM9_9STRA|nr:expressed unknown protein [Seminavis robusta]|eukprot:Sro2_g001950.1 n/a (319) ;mRNA; r:282887-283843
MMTRLPLFLLCCLVILVLILTEAVEEPQKRGISLPKGVGEYDEHFFNDHEMLRPIFDALVTEMYKLLPRGKRLSSVLDVGCGTGYLVEAWRSETPLSKSYCVEGSSNAAPHWPAIFARRYYQTLDLQAPTAVQQIPKTDVVTSFEVAEHLPPSHADRFIQLLVHHSPAMVFFGAATPDQDQGKNPSHVNENTLGYWIDQFRHQQYIIDFEGTAFFRYNLLKNPVYVQYFGQAWWYVKNALIFVPQRNQTDVDQAIIHHPEEINLLSPNFLDIGKGRLEHLWKRDWTEFATLFYQEQDKAAKRIILQKQQEYDDGDDEL